ncbi:MAG: cell envelope integrity protein CreD [Lewinellaceae bacterium]|nr:cell envelope integrity protein CreD [Lewinellaceae bacterium]
METPVHTEISFWERHGATIKGVMIAFLVLVLLIPTFMIQGLISERESRQAEAIFEVSSKWGQSQTIAGPFLVIPYERPAHDQSGKEIGRSTHYACFLPDELSVNSQVTPEKRHRGIFDVVLYSGRISLEGVFKSPATDKLIPNDATVLWDQAVMLLGIPDLRGLEDQVTLRWHGHDTIFDPGIPVSGIVASGISCKPDLSAGSTGDAHPFRIDLSLRGSKSLFFTPVGRVTTVQMQAPWGDPSFTGAFLPGSKNVTNDKFEANWKVLNLNRNYPQQWTNEQQVNFGDSAFGVDFLLPIDNYQKSTRSVKYAILFIALTFLTIFFIEMRQKSRVHPFQYALIGLALVVFYTLLVSISEQTSFNNAYAISAFMTIALTALYTRSLFDSNRMALLVAGTLAVLYGFLFVVLQQQDYALLIGSLGLFIILAVVMYVSRRISWDLEESGN